MIFLFITCHLAFCIYSQTRFACARVRRGARVLLVRLARARRGARVLLVRLVVEMSAYDEVEIEDMEWNAELGAYTYPCPCGDLFQITLADLRLGEEIARCPSCSLFITVVYNEEDLVDAKERPPKPAPRPVAVA
uniref:Diphthamide biosynthesis protein 3 n=1 Tax=Oryza brachyantha TaxID=4533 RepID=J3MGI2_ORYBR